MQHWWVQEDRHVSLLSGPLIPCTACTPIMPPGPLSSMTWCVMPWLTWPNPPTESSASRMSNEHWGGRSKASGVHCLVLLNYKLCFLVMGQSYFVLLHDHLLFFYWCLWKFIVSVETAWNGDGSGLRAGWLNVLQCWYNNHLKNNLHAFLS